MPLLVIFIIILLLWLVLVALHAVRITPTQLSDYELERRVAAKNEDAVLLKQREKALPDIRALKFALETLLVIAVIALAVLQLGAFWGIVLMFVLAVAAGPATRWQVISRPAQQLYDKYELDLVQFAERWHRIFKWLHADGNFTPGQFVYSKEELLSRLATTHGVVSKHELLLLEHGLQFGDTPVSKVMTPRTVIDAVKASDTLGPVVLNRLHASGHSRFPVFEGDVDHVVGMLYLRDLVPLKKNVQRVADAMQKEVFYVREDQTLEHALAAFLRTHHHLFVVVNGYRETVGLLSLEDVVEALLGRKIIDEFDRHHDLRAVAERNPRANNLPPKRRDI